MVCVITAIFAVAQFAIPASMLTWGFEQEAERRIKKNHDKRAAQLKRVKEGTDLGDQWSSASSDGNSDDLAEEWKEYEGVVVDSDQEEAPSESQAKQKGKKELSAKQHARVLKIFKTLDTEGRGWITTKEIALKGWDLDAWSHKLDPDSNGRTYKKDFVGFV